MAEHWFYKVCLKSDYSNLNDDKAPVASEPPLADRERILTERAKSLAEREDTASDKEKALMVREAALLELMNALENQKRVIADYKNSFAEQEQIMADREHELSDRENALKNREWELEQREKILQERAELLSAPKEPDRDLSKEMNELISVYKQLAETVKHTSKDVVALGSEVKRWHQDGVRALCDLCLDMTLTRDEQLLSWARKLEQILEHKFHVESLEPRTGDDYDPELHVRLDATRTGQKVLVCRSKGWQREDEVLLRAVVETE